MNWIEIIEGDETTLPKVGEEVLIYTKWGDFEVSAQFAEKSVKYVEVENGLYKKVEETFILWNVNLATHWMPLPLPPLNQK